MSFLDELRETRETASSAYHLFLLDYSKDPKAVYVFLEGRDDSSFYTAFLRKFASDFVALHIYRCGNKMGVYEAYDKVSRRSTHSGITLFFVDKDLSDILAEDYTRAPDIYVTDYYSVENYVVSENMLWRVWEDFYYVKEARVDFRIVAKKFREELTNFYDFIRPIMVWIVYCRRNGVSPTLNNINLSSICIVDEDCAVKSLEGLDLINELEQRCRVNTPEGYATACEKISSELLVLESKMYVRGKFELWFFVKFLERLKQGVNDITLELGQRLKVRTTIGKSNAMEVLGPRTDIPESLEIFLEEHFVDE
jgi:hypothetical protein